MLVLLVHTPVRSSFTVLSRRKNGLGDDTQVRFIAMTLACAMLLCLPKYKDSIVVRSRDPDVLKLCGTVVDVGAVYDPSKNMFDHHPATLAASNVFPGHNIKLSSAGLVYKHFGGEIIESLVGPLDKSTRELLVNKVYERVVKEVDAIDNGVSIADDTKYKINTNLSSRVGRLNPDWNASPEESSDKALETVIFVWP